MTTTRDLVADQRDQFAFHDDIVYLAETKRGLSRATVEEISGIKNEPDWCLASPTSTFSYWPQRLWTMDKNYHFLGDGGGMGIGYCASASACAALANRKHGRLTVAIQPDGDLLMTIGVLWTAAHHKIPVLWVVHNNRGYHQEVMHVQLVAARLYEGQTTNFRTAGGGFAPIFTEAVDER